MLYEFVEKDVDKTMATMIDEPYVNHIPTCTGGVGYKNLYNFYKYHFIPQNPASLKMKLISRTVGSDRIVDEMVATFTHDCRMDWMLPGVEPTGRRVEVALVSIVCVRGGKLYHEHIYWYVASLYLFFSTVSWFNHDEWWLLIRALQGPSNGAGSDRTSGSERLACRRRRGCEKGVGWRVREEQQAYSGLERK